MTQLPNCEKAILDIRKLEDYCLDAVHPRGRHKARVFRDALSIGKTEAAWLRERLLAALRVSGAELVATDEFGTRWRLDVLVTRQNKRAVVRTLWIIRAGEEFPRFVTCWVL